MHQLDAGVEHAGHAGVQDAAVVARIVNAAGGGRPGHPAQRQAAADVDATQIRDRVEAAHAIARGEDASGIRDWLESTLAGVFDRETREVLFTGYLAHFERGASPSG